MTEKERWRDGGSFHDSRHETSRAGTEIILSLDSILHKESDGTAESGSPGQKKNYYFGAKDTHRCTIKRVVRFVIGVEKAKTPSPGLRPTSPRNRGEVENFPMSSKLFQYAVATPRPGCGERSPHIASAM